MGVAAASRAWQTHRQLRGDKGAIGDGVGHRIELLDSAKGISVRHNRLALAVPAVNLQVAPA